MSGSRTLTFAFAAALAAGPAAAQQFPTPPSPLVRADVHGTLGWFNAQADVSTYDDWYNRSLYGGAGLGWYWTDHLKTEVEFGGATTAELYSSEPVVFAGRITYVGIRQKVGIRKVSAGQHYQFFRNRWFHPHLAAGADLTWQTVERRHDPVLLYDPVTRQGRLAGDLQRETSHTSRRVRPFAAAGFKAYMTERGFFRSDLRVAVRGGVDEVLLRFGFGVDF